MITKGRTNLSIGLLGNKIGMTQIYDSNGQLIPITVIKAGPCFVTQIKTKPVNGYNSIQVGYEINFKKKISKPQLGHLQKSNLNSLKYLKEFKVNATNTYSLGQILNVTLFLSNQYVDITGKTSGKGFSGTQKRHKFAGGPMTHGSKNHKSPGSIGMGTTPGRVFPGKKMAGQLGNKTITTKKTRIIQINLAENILLVKGSVPGKPGSLLTISPYLKFN